VVIGCVEPESLDDPMPGLVASATPPTTDVAMIAIPTTMPAFGTILVADTGTLLLPSGREPMVVQRGNATTQ